jgi:membrane protease YdiL (CAAX protease family)
MNGLVWWLRRLLVEPDDADRDAGSLVRRRVIVVATLLAGTAMLGLLLRVRPGDAWFYQLGLLQAGVWAAGGLGSGPLRLARPTISRRQSVVAGLAVGLALGAVFLAGAVSVRDIGVLRGAVTSVLQYASGNALAAAAVVAVANGVGEELFFRGAVYAAANGQRPVLASTLVYAAATTATGNVMLVFAAAVVGLVLGLQRRHSGGVLAPVVGHAAWSLLMLFGLPRIFST